MIIPLFYDRQLYEAGYEIFVNWHVNRYPHVLCIGGTGSGKTTATKWALRNVAQLVPTAQIYICDFKNDDYKTLEGLPRYYAFTDVLKGIDDFCNLLKQRQSGEDKRRNFCLLMIDEYSALLNCLEKKQAEAVKSQVSTMLNIGRSFGLHLWISQQRGDSEFFNRSRDNFSQILACGNPSKESCAMFGFDRDKMLPCRRGQGHALFDGCNQTAFTVPRIRDFTHLNNEIKKALQ